MNIITISYSKTFSDTRVIKYIKFYLERSFNVTCFGLDDNDNNHLYKNQNFKYKKINLKLEKDNNKIGYKSIFTKLFFKILILAIITLIFTVLNEKINHLEFKFLNKIVLNSFLLISLFFLIKKNFFLIFLKRLLSFSKRLFHFSNEINLFLEKEENKKNFDIIHTHDLWTILAALRIKKKFPNSKLLIDLHELYTELPNQSLLQKFISLTFIYYLKLYKKKIYKIITINEEIKNYYTKRFKLSSMVINNSCEDDKIDNCINLDNIPTSLIKLKQEGHKILIYQGGLSPHRGIEEICNFFVKYPPKNWVFLVMGNGKLKSIIDDLILKTNNIFIIPAVSLDKLFAYTNFADLGLINYVNNCLNHNFCNPNKLWEYSRCSLPMMLSNCQSFINLNEKYQFAKIIDTNNIAKLSEIFKNLDIKELSKMSKNSKLFYDNNNWEKEKIKIDREILSIK